MKKILSTVVAELPPSSGNPRNSEGAFLTLEDGRIIFVYSRFKGTSDADNATADICVLFSDDNGKSFGNEHFLFSCESENAVNIMSISLMTMENGDIGLFYLVRATNRLMRMYLRRSSDNCESWSERVLCTPQEGFFVANNDRVVKLSDNSIIIPVACHRKGYRDNPDETTNGFFDPRSEVLFFKSTDDGKSWTEAEGKCVLPDLSNSRSGLQEPGLIELASGVLWGWARTDLGRQYEFFSYDNGNHWSSAQPSCFSGPLSPLSMKRGTDNRIYAIWNPVPLYNGRADTYNNVWTGGRNPFVIAAGKAGGHSFSQPVIIEDDDAAGFCYCAMHFTKDGLLIGYCAGGAGDSSCLARTRIRYISNEALQTI